ncbi:MAG: hypothetical protein V7609_2992 [Verrucomicrobiota bacterium]
MHRRLSRWSHLFALAALLATASFAAGKKKKAAAPSPSPSPSPPQLIEITGSILGVALFAGLEEGREKMKAFKLEEEAAAESSEEEEREAGERMIWRLAETEYLWIVAWADKEGKVVKISASVRPEKRKPFREIGDLARAKVHDDSMAMWVARHRDGTYYRLVAKGPGEQASSIYLYSLKPEPIN